MNDDERPLSAQEALRTNPELLAQSLERRGENPALARELQEADERKRETRAAWDELRRRQKELGQKVGAATGDEKKALLDRGAALAEKVKEAGAVAASAEEKLEALWRKMPNLVDPLAPVGGEDAFELIEIVGAPRNFEAEGFEAKDHIRLGRSLGAIDTERGAKVSGSRFYYLTGQGVKLELALQGLAVELAENHGLTLVMPPTLVRPPAMEGTGFLGQAAENVYRVEQDDLYLTGTSEVALAAYHGGEIIEEDDLPLRYAGISPCYRREAGSGGKDTAGIIRVHQFNKIEMFVLCVPEDAKREHELLLKWEKEFLDALELPYRVIDVATGDLGASAARKYDIEAWIPTQGTFREVTSTSNTTEYQARRLGIRMRGRDGVIRPLATLNGTLVAMPRVIVAILENHQTKEGNVRIPERLRAHMGGKTELTPVAKPFKMPTERSFTIG